jgi:mRNA-degrading endonuclease toxin of MazEF toxin-antitoxin module
VARVRIDPDDSNNLKTVSFIMADKLFSFDKADLEKPIGALSAVDMERVSEKLKAVLGL